MPSHRPRRKKIENFPADPAAKIRYCNGHTYVVRYERIPEADGHTRVHTVLLGKILGRRYYSIEEYRRNFTRNGTPRLPIRPDVRTYTRSQSIPAETRHWKRRTDLPSPASIENFPLDNPRARIVVLKDRNGREKWYVCASTYIRYDGKGHEKRIYLGVIVNGRYYPMREYKRLYGRRGASRSPGKASDPAPAAAQPEAILPQAVAPGGSDPVPDSVPAPSGTLTSIPATRGRGTDTSGSAASETDKIPFLKKAYQD